jgi:hypothetical protein
MRSFIKQYIQECETCQRNKSENVHPAGLLQPLPVPHQIWEDISMDFIDGLPKSSGKNVIFVVVDRLSKYAHFIAMSHPYTASSIAQAFFDNVFKFHGMPKTIVSDHDRVFLSDFWQQLFKLQGTSLHFSSSYHPQTDGQTEVINRCLQTYLRCFVSLRPKDWMQFLTLAEYWHNTNVNSSTGYTPFEAVYGCKPPKLVSYIDQSSSLPQLDELLSTRSSILQLLRQNLSDAQNRMKTFADRKRTEREFEVGDYVYLRLQPYRQCSVAT